MAIDLNAFKSNMLEYVNPALFEVEFLSSKLTPEEIDRLKFNCSRAEVINLPGQVAIILTFNLDEDGLITAALTSANSVGSPLRITSFFKDGEVRQIEEFDYSSIFGTKIVLDWSRPSTLGTIVVTYEPIPVDKVSNTVYHR